MPKNRGKSLEKTVSILINQYKKLRIPAFRMHEAPHFQEKAPFDYLVYYKGIAYAFDAKECALDDINIKSNLKLHQIDNMMGILGQGGEGFFLIYFTNQKKLTRLPAEQVLLRIGKGEKSISYKDCEETPLDFLGVFK